jgi:serine/threonine-protein kinase
MPTQTDVNFVLAAVKYRFLDTGKAKELFEMYKVAETSGVKYPISNIAISYGYLTSQQAEQLGKALQVKIDKKKINQIASYRLINKLGAGSMGVVYKAKHVQSGQDVALKILLKRFYDDPDYLERFYREAQASAQLQHPNLIRAIEAGKSKEGYHFFAMEFVDGESVQSILDREHTVPEKRAIEIAIQVIRALEHASSRGIVHRDIKPDNLMITKTGVVKVADFGLARETDSSVTQTGIALGTPHYMSPEQVRGEHTVDIRSDLYSTGATLYHMITGNPPFVGTSAAVVITKHLTTQVTHPKEKNPNLSDGICQIVLRMMEKEQADRYQSAAELLQDIDVLVNGGAFPQTVANNQLSPVQRSVTPNFNQPQSGAALQPIAESPTAVTPGRASSGRLSLANSSSAGRLGGAGSTSFRSRRRSAASLRSASIVDNYVKPICIGIAASLLCILIALGIYFTLRPAPRQNNNSPRVEAPRSTRNAPAFKITNLPPRRTPGT